MDDIYTHDQLLRYIDREMEEAERTAFENRLKQEPELDRQLHELLAGISALRLHAEEQQVRAFINGLYQEEKLQTQPAKAPAAKILSLSLKAAAAVLLLAIAAGIIWFITLQPQSVYRDHFIAYHTSQPRSNERLDQVRVLYEAGDYAAVIKTASPEASEEEQFLLALSFYQTGSFSQAHNLFQKLRTSTAFRDDGDYYEALSLVALERPAEAYTILKKIRDNKNHLYHQQVTTWLLFKLRMLSWKS